MKQRHSDSATGRRSFLLSAAALGAGVGLPASTPASEAGPWKGGKKWVYSITYDEGVVDLFKHAVPMHRKHNIPGHLAIVSEQVGKVRILPGSSYHGFSILNKEQVRELVDEGWGVSCHSMTHCGVTEENAEREVVEARKVLEEALDLPITMFTVPGTNHGHAPAIKFAEAGGYNSILTIYDRVNTFETDLLWLGRTPLHTEFPGPFYSVFDPYHRLLQAQKNHGWIIDYNHCPMPGKPIHPAKDATLEQLEARFEAVKEIGGDEVWIAEPHEVVEFLLSDNQAKAARVRNPDPESMVQDIEMRMTYAILDT
jgi:hypothetical protein